MMEKIEKTVREILKESKIGERSECVIRKVASERLGFDLFEVESYTEKARNVVTSFFDELLAKSTASMKEKEYVARAHKWLDDNGDLVICRVRKLTAPSLIRRDVIYTESTCIFKQTEL